MKENETLAVSQEVSGVPAEIQVIPWGRHDTGKGAFVLDEEGMAAVLADFDSRDNDMVIDYEHQSLGGGEAPAAGWIKRLFAVLPGGPRGNAVPPRSKGLWAVVEWTDRAKGYFRNREYRYLSPVFLKTTEDGRVVRLLNAALTNTPAIDGMVPIVNRGGDHVPPACPPSTTRKGDRVPLAYPPKTESRGDHVPPARQRKGRYVQTDKKEEKAMLGKLIELLGLETDATEEEVLKAVSALVEAGREADAMKEALGLGARAGLSEATGTIEAMKQGHAMAGELGTRLAALEAAMREKGAEELVAHAMGEGKVTPAQRDWALAYAGRDPEGFRTFAARSPVVVPMAEVAGGAGYGGGLRVDELQLSVNRALGVDEETFRKHNA